MRQRVRCRNIMRSRKLRKRNEQRRELCAKRQHPAPFPPLRLAPRRRQPLHLPLRRGQNAFERWQR